jgi:hypothetical protein
LDQTGRFKSAAPDSSVDINVNNAAAMSPRGALTTPQPNDKLTGAVKVSGYAYAPAGRITHVQLVVDGYPLTELPYGVDRTQVCTNLPDATACPNIGFEATFDTTRLVNGPHNFLIVLQDDRGNASMLPAIGFSGINVIVTN